MERVGALLRDLEGGEPLRRRLAEARALERWPDLVGPHLAQRTRPLRVAGKRLLVIAHGAALRQELVFHKQAILRKFNRAAGTRAASEIVFLESDANLSSLLHESEDAPVTAPARTQAAEPVEESEPDGCAYATFDAEAYRRELRKIEGE